MMPSNVLVVIGISGVGKSYTISEGLRHASNYTHFSASQLIKLAAKNIDPESLRKNDRQTILNNQLLMVEGFKQEIAGNHYPHIVFDAHAFIDNDAELIEIPVKIFADIGTSKIIHLWDTPEEILARRNADSKRVRPQRTFDQLCKHQQLSLDIAKRYSKALAIDFVEIRSGDVPAFAQTLRG